MVEGETREGGHSSGRLSYLNYVRIGAIMLVLLLHCLPHVPGGQYESSYLFLTLNELARGGVPLFFMLSGFLLLRDKRTREFLPFYKRRMARILIPLAVWNVIYAVLYGMTLRQFLDGLLNQGCAYHLWFLYQLAGLYLLAPFLKIVVDGCTRRQLWGLLLLIAFPGAIRTLFNLYTPFYMFLFGALIEPYTAYFLLGYLVGTAKPTRGALPAAFGAALAGVCLGVFGNRAALDRGETELIYNGGYYLNHLLLGGGAFYILRSAAFPDRPFAVKIGEAIAPLTFQVYLVHVLILEWYKRIKPDLPIFAQKLLEYVVVAAGSFLFALLWRLISGVFKRYWGLFPAGRRERKSGDRSS